MKRFICTALVFITVFITLVSVFAADTEDPSADTSTFQFTTEKALPSGRAGESYAYQLAAEGGVEPYTYTISNTIYLPRGLTLDSNGLIEGKPAAAMNYNNIEVTVTDSSETPQSVTKIFTMQVLGNTVKFEITDYTHTYDGEAHKATIEPIGQNGVSVAETLTPDKYQVTYGTAPQTVAETQTDAGTYPISITLSSDSFGIGELTASNLVINKNPWAEIKFDGTEFEYIKDTAQGPDVTVWAKMKETDTEQTQLDEPKLTYKSLDGGGYSDTEPPENAGRYQVTAELSDNNQKNFLVPEVTSTEFVITAKPITLELSDLRTPYSAGTAQYPTIMDPTGELTGDDYEVTYINTKDESETADPMAAGEYKIVITPKSDNYTISYDEAATFTIFDDSGISLDNGNSIAAKVLAVGGDVNQDFVAVGEKGYTYGGVYYSPLAWAGSNLDADEKAFFVYSGESVALPGVKGYGTDGTEVAVTTTLVAADGSERVITTDGLTPTDLPYGVYTLRYSIAESETPAERALVVLWPLGDANRDGYVNSIDGNFVKKNGSTLPEDTAAEKLFKYRVCNVFQDLDSELNQDDVDAIYNRFKTPFAQYYM